MIFVPSARFEIVSPTVLGDDRTVVQAYSKALTVGFPLPPVVLLPMIWHDMIRTPPLLLRPPAMPQTPRPLLFTAAMTPCDMRSVVRVFRIAVIPADRLPVEFGGVVPEIIAVFLRILRIRPDVRPQVGMGGLHGFVDHRDDNLLAARAELPGIQQVDVGPRLRLDGDIRKEASAGLS